MAEFSLKDHLFNRAKVQYLASLFAAQDPEFPARSFVSRVMSTMPKLELKERIGLIADVLAEVLPSSFPAAARTIVASLPPPLDPQKTDDDFGDFIFAPLGEFIVRQGVSRRHLPLTLRTLKELTQRFSMEDAIRVCLRQFPTETLAELTIWASDHNYHVRRLVSEGTRPRLPWSGRVDLSVESTLPLLDRLHADPTRYVTRSVANHLNDIAKTEPETVLKALKRWQKAGEQSPSELNWLTRHALRTLVKQGHAGALQLLGYRAEPQLSVGEIRLERRRIQIGESLQFAVAITALRDEHVVVDYAIDFVKAGGKRSTKVFKGTKFFLKCGEVREVKKTHKLRGEATTYQLYPGEHRLTVQVNGQPRGTQTFDIV